MRAFPAGVGSRVLVLAVVGFTALWALDAGAIAQDKTGKKAEPIKIEQRSTDAAPKQEALKTYTFEMRNKPWNQVVEWVADTTGLAFTGPNMPTGTFNFIAPNKKQYTIPEIIDLINEALLANKDTNKYILIRRNTTFMFVPADDPIEESILPRIKVEELDARGNTEVVQIVLQLQGLVAEDVAPQIEKKMLGPFGRVAVIEAANQLVLRDTAGNLKRVVKTLDEIAKMSNAETFSHKCVYIKARTAAQILKDLLGDPAKLLAQLAAQQQQQMGGFRGGFQQMQQQPPQQQAPAQAAQKIRMHYISFDETANTVLVTGPADVIAKAKEILKRLDTDDGGNRSKVIGGSPQIKTYVVTSGTAEKIAETLKDHYKDATSIKITAAGSSKIIVLAPPDDQVDIAKHIEMANGDGNKTELINLTVLDANDIAGTLQQIYGDPKESKGLGPIVKADGNRNAIIVNGTKEQIDDVKLTIKALGDGGVTPTGGGTGGTSIISLPEGSAAALAEAIAETLNQMGRFKVKVITPSTGKDKKEPEKKENVPEPSRVKPPGTSDQRKSDARGDSDTYLVAATANQLVDPQEQKKEKKDEKKGGEVTITAYGNRLIIHSDDPEALRMVNELIRLYTRSTAGPGDFEVIKLKKANAVEIAKVIDEAFNGPRQQNQQQGFGRFGAFGPGGLAFPQQNQAQTAQQPTVRIVADPATNSLLVRAKPIDMLTVRSMISKLDVGDTDSDAVIKTFVLKLEHANATQVSTILKDVYRESMNNNPLPGQPGGGRGFGPFGQNNRNVDANGNPRGVTLSISVDDGTNSLIVGAPKSMYEDIKALVAQLEKAAKDSTRTVRFVPIRGVDPAIIQQALDAIQGRTTSSQNQMGQFGGFRGFGPGGGGFGPGGFRGFGPGGGGFGPGGGMRPGGGFGGGGRPGASLDREGTDREGSRFFAERVKDDPRATLLYDPQLDVPPFDSEIIEASRAPQGAADASKPGTSKDGIQQASYTAQAQPAQPGQNLPGTRSQVQAESLPGLGGVIISANNPQDIEAVLAIIEWLQRNIVPQTEIVVQYVPLKQADATSVVSILNQLYQRVNVTPSGAVGLIGGPATTTTAIGPFQQQTQQQQTASVALLPVPRFNAIFAATSKVRMEEVLQRIKELDVASPTQATPIPLKRAGAQRMSQILQVWFAQRYPGEQNQVRITFDTPTNTIFIQAAPGDIAEARRLIERIETGINESRNDIRIVQLKNALSDDLSRVLTEAIALGVVQPTTPTTTFSATTGVPGAPGGGVLGGAPGGFGGGFGGAGGGLAGQPGGLGGGQPGGFAGGAPGGALGGAGGIGGGALGAGGGLGGAGALGAAGGRPAGTTTTTGVGGTITTKSTSLRFVSPRAGGKAFESGPLEDVYIISDARTNSLILLATEKTMDLLLALVQELDVLPQVLADINIIPLKRADATQTANVLQQLLFGTSTGARTTTTPGGLGGPLGGLGTTGGLLGGGQLPGAPGSVAGTGGTGGAAGLHISVDERTNSIIVAGNPNDLLAIYAIVSRLDDADVQTRRNEVYQLHNAQAADVAQAISTYYTNSLGVLTTGNQLTNFQEIQRQVIVVPEPITNKLLINVTPQYYPEVMRLIGELDTEQPQVVIQVLIAEVSLDGSEEFGVEIGVQSPVLFRRGIIPLPNFFGPNGVVNYTTPTTGVGLVAPGVTVNNSLNPTALPSYNFNTTAPLGTNPVADPGIVGWQGITNLGVGRISPTSGVGGFVLSASSDSFNLLMRALKTQARLDVLSRPQIMTLDNQTASLLIGQNFPVVTSTNVTATGLVTNGIQYVDVGVSLSVTPKISPDGKVLMRVTPVVSSVAPTQVSLGNGATATAFNTQQVATTVIAGDGETVAIGGLIQKRDQKTENKVPWLGDLAVIGSLFRARFQQKHRQELIVILTPHIVRNRMEADRVLAEESRRMDWIVGNVLDIHGTSGMGPILPPGTPGALTSQLPAGPAATPHLPGDLDQVPTLPPPTPVPVETPKPAGPAAQALPAPPATNDAPAPPAAVAPLATANASDAPANPGKESSRWNLFHKKQ